MGNGIFRHPFKYLIFISRFRPPPITLTVSYLISQISYLTLKSNIYLSFLATTYHPHCLISHISNLISGHHITCGGQTS